MNKLEFATKEEFKIYLKKNIIKVIGEGSEGICCLLKDGSALKVYVDFDNDYEPFPYSSIDEKRVEDIIMYNDIKIENFLFPEQLLLVENKVRAYKTKYIPNDCFGNYFYPEMVNFEKLIEAYYDFVKQTIIISKMNIFYYDLAYNLIFDNNKLYAIDTIGYKRKENVLEDNIKSLRNAISMGMDLFIKRAGIKVGKIPTKSIYIHEEETIEEFLTRVRSELEKYIEPSQFTKNKNIKKYIK